MKHKSETFEKFKEFQSEVQNHRNKKINFLRSDRGGEYFSCDFGLHAPLMNGLFFLNLDRSDTHIDAKGCKVDNDSATYLWHCCLGHIDVKCMKKLHADGLLESLVM